MSVDINQTTTNCIVITPTGAVGTLLTYPLDVLRVRLALMPSSSWSSAIGQGGLYQGLAPTMLGIIPYSGTSWMVKQSLQELFPKVISE